MPIFKTTNDKESIDKAQAYLKRSGLDQLTNPDDLNLARDIAFNMSCVDLFSLSNLLGEMPESDMYKVRLLSAISMQNNLIIRQLMQLNSNIEKMNGVLPAVSNYNDTKPKPYVKEDASNSNASGKEKDLLRRLGYIK